MAAAMMAAFMTEPALAQQQRGQATLTLEPMTGPRVGTTLQLPLNKSQVVRVNRPIGKLAVGNADIVDAVPLTERSFYVLGKGLGTTNIAVYGPMSQLLAVLDVTVGADVEGVKAALHDMLPNERIEVRSVKDAIALNGGVSSATKAQQAVAIAERFAKKVINNMGVRDVQQVMLEVKVSEMLRSVSTELGFHPFFNAGKNPASGTGFRIAGLDPIDAARFATVAGTFISGKYTFSDLIDALEQRGVIKILAEPNLVAMSGDTANFLVGGEFPVPVASTNSGTISGGGTTVTSITPTITVEFKPFGVSLAFTPTVLDEGLINLIVAPEVSQIDKTTAPIVANGFTIPGISTRRARTTVELRDGQTFAIAGLLQEDFTDDIRQIPGLGDIPILGTLFRSSQYQRKQTELVILVTPRLVRPAAPEKFVLPTDSFVGPSDVDMILYGRPEAPDSGLAPPAGSGGGLMNRYGHIVQ